MLLFGVVVAVLAVRVLTAPFPELASSDPVPSHYPYLVKCDTAFTPNGHINSRKTNANYNQNINEDVLPAVEKRQDVEQNEAHICAAHVCPPRFGGVIVEGVCQCVQLVGLRPISTPALEKRQNVEQDEAHICAAHVCPPRFGGVIVEGVCQCIQLVGLRPTSTVSTIQPTKTATVNSVKRQGIATGTSVATRQEIVEDEAIICAVRVCPPRFGAIIIDGNCTCTRFGLPPPTPVKRSEIAHEDCETPCESGYIGKLFGEYCRCVPPQNDNLFINAITKRQEVDNCFARTCPPRFFSAPDGKGGCDCVQGTKFAPPTA